MKDMGFNENASLEVKKAFIKYLMREVQFHDRLTDMSKYMSEKNSCEDLQNQDQELNIQLSLFDLTGTE